MFEISSCHTVHDCLIISKANPLKQRGCMDAQEEGVGPKDEAQD